MSMDKPSQARAEAICKHHLILGQRLYKELEGQDLWTYGGEIMRFKPNKVNSVCNYFGVHMIVCVCSQLMFVLCRN